jgi:hypothetical protein
MTSSVSDIDFFDIMLTNPNSALGEILYRDVDSGIYSTDFNTFLFNVIESNGTTETWNDILDIKFNQNGQNTNNELSVTVNQRYDNKSLDDLNNDFVDSITIFDVEKIVTALIDTTFGSISLNKTTKQLNKEIAIENIIQNIINLDEDDVMNDCYFIFDNKEISELDEEAKNRKNGIRKLTCCNNVLAEIPQDFLTNFNNDLNNATSVIEQRDVINNSLDGMAEQSSLNSPNKQDKFNIKINFFEKLLNELLKNIVKVMLSTHIITIFLINFKIIYGKDERFKDVNDFFSKNKNNIKSVIDGIKDIVIKEMLKVALKEITTIVAANQVKSQITKNKARISQLLSLVGVPQETIRLIKGLA